MDCFPHAERQICFGDLLLLAEDLSAAGAAAEAEVGDDVVFLIP